MTDGCLFQCAVCRAKLNLTFSSDTNLDPFKIVPAGLAANSSLLNVSALDVSRLDESFVVLDDKRHAGPSHKALDESFVVLGSASLLRQTPSGAGSSSTPASEASGLDSKLQGLAKLFELASTSLQVDHPLCLDCAAQLKEEIDTQIHETEKEIAAYSAAVARLEAESCQPMPTAQFEEEMETRAAEETELRQELTTVEAELAAVEQQLAAVQADASAVEALEERYWHDFNEHQYQLKLHVEERDALLNKIDRDSQRLQLLKNTNVHNDAFKIWHDGPFGTICGCRLGRTPEIHVEWEEINAAWGHAVLLLHTMAQTCRLTFSSYRLQPMGSHPRIADKRGVYDLFGPVSKYWSSSYDRAMVCYLACLREFSEFARARDLAEGKEPAFEFPFPIDNDKVDNLTIKLTLNKDAKWTKALKFMLADLKKALKWVVERELQDMPQLPNLGHEGPAMMVNN